MNNRTPKSLLAHLLCAFALVTGSTAQADIALSTSPLFLSSSVSPNLMLLFDNSGSMRNMIWHSGYDPAGSYPDWSQSCGRNSRDACWTSSDTTVETGDIPRGSCPSGWRQGRKEINSGAVTKCLKLPFPLTDSGGTNITRYYGSYLNYLFETFANNTDLTTGNRIPLDTRIAVAKNVSTDLINSNSMLRWGLARFNLPTSGNNGPGGLVTAACGSAISDITAAIAAVPPDSNTPLAETYYEVTRYFRGMSSYYGTQSYTSPIQYRCQKNFVIVVTDGFPTYDNTFPSNDPADTADAASSLPNWDNRAPSTSSSEFPFFRQYSDGFKGESGKTEGNEGYTLYLDDLAKFGFDTDLRTTGNDLTGISFNDSNFLVQRLNTYTIGLAINNQMLRDAATYGSGRSFTANDSDSLKTALQSALNDIASRTSAAASVATNSTRLTADTAIYQARFNTADWSGQFLSLGVNLDGSIGATNWDAAQEVPVPASRRIFTYDPTASAANRGKVFAFNQLNAAQQAALNRDGNGTVDGRGAARLDYLRGVRSGEGSAAGSFRTRSSVLGDIVNSDPAFVGDQDYGFSKLPGAEGSSYQGFRSSTAYKARPATLYVGANDGMLHGFRASDGEELMAYVPSALYDRLGLLTEQDYNQKHQYYVDGSPRVLDAYLGGWKTVLLGALGGGGRGVFALDVTDPEGFGTQDVMWEYGPANDADMGHSYPQATVARLANGKWAAVVGNGYNSGSGRAVLFLLDLETGAQIAKFDTRVGGDNGLSSPIPVDVDGDRITDFIYAGDLKGNLWKVDVRGASAGSWRFAFGSAAAPQPLFNAGRPITGRPEVGINPAGGYIVYFGTGRYFAASDNIAGGGTDSFYGIYDRDDGTSPSGRGQLQEQRVLTTVTRDFGGVPETVRLTTNNTVDAHELGWYIDLPASGERQVSNPILRGGAVIFTTLIPNTDKCGFGGDSFLMELDAVTGSRLLSTPFDLNRDTAFDEGDEVTYNGESLPVSGRRSKEGIIKTPAIISAGAFDVKLASGTTGGIDTTIEQPRSVNPGGRLSWRQIQ